MQIHQLLLKIHHQDMDHPSMVFIFVAMMLQGNFSLFSFLLLFPHFYYIIVSLRIQPRKGRAVLFYNLIEEQRVDGVGDPSTLHVG